MLSICIKLEQQWLRSLLGIAGDVTAPTYAEALRRKIQIHCI